MPKHKVRLPDGIELGPVGQNTLRSWFEGGTLRKDSQVQPVGSRRWSRLMDAVNIQSWQMPAPAAQRARGPAASGTAAPRARERAEPAEAWRIRVAATLLMIAAAGAGYFSLFPARWLPSLRLTPWREIALGSLAMGLSLVRAWGWARLLVRVALCALTFALFPLAGVLWVDGVRGAGLRVMASALVLGSGFFALLAGGRLSALGSAVRVLLVIAGGAGVGYFGLQP
jgi:hypothetical protein